MKIIRLENIWEEKAQALFCVFFVLVQTDIHIWTQPCIRVCLSSCIDVHVCLTESGRGQQQDWNTLRTYLNAAGVSFSKFLFASKSQCRWFHTCNILRKKNLRDSYFSSLPRSCGGQLTIMRYRNTEALHIGTYTLKSCVTVLLHGRWHGGYLKQQSTRDGRKLQITPTQTELAEDVLTVWTCTGKKTVIFFLPCRRYV